LPLDELELRGGRRLRAGLVAVAGHHAGEAEGLPLLGDALDQRLAAPRGDAQLGRAVAEDVQPAGLLPFLVEERAFRVDVRVGDRVEDFQDLGVELTEETVRAPFAVETLVAHLASVAQGCPHGWEYFTCFAVTVGSRDGSYLHGLAQAAPHHLAPPRRARLARPLRRRGRGLE